MLKTIIEKTILLLLLNASGPSVSHASGCAWLPSHQEKLQVEGHRTWKDDSLRIFDHEQERFVIPKGWEPVGNTSSAESCASFPKKQPAVYVNTGRYYHETLALPGASFKIKIFLPKALKKNHAQKIISEIYRINEGLSSLYPQGLSTTDPEAFHLLVTSGVAGNSYDAKSLIAPSPGTSLAAISLPAQYDRISEQIVHSLVHLYAKARPSAGLGPASRSEKRNLRIDFGSSTVKRLSLDDYDALVAGWAVMKYAYPTPERRLEAIYHKLMDLAGHLDNAEGTFPIDNLLTGRTASSKAFFSKWGGLENADDAQSYFFRHVLSPLKALRLAGILKENDLDIEEVFLSVHNGTAANLEDALPLSVRRQTEGAWRHHISQIEKQPAETRSFGADFFEDAGRLNITRRLPKATPEYIRSQSALLESHLYFKGKAELSPTVFLLVADKYPGRATKIVRPNQHIMSVIARRLLAYGDVLVLARDKEGRTQNALSESYQTPCALRDMHWAVQKGGIHISDAARWLRLRGYRNVVGIGLGHGAAAMASTASHGSMDRAYLIDPWRGRIGRFPAFGGMSVTQCGGDAYLKALESFLQDTQAPYIAISSRNELGELLQRNGWLDSYNKPFSRSLWFDIPEWTNVWSATAFRPELWLQLIEKDLQ